MHRIGEQHATAVEDRTVFCPVFTAISDGSQGQCVAGIHSRNGLSAQQHFHALRHARQARLGQQAGKNGVRPRLKDLRKTGLRNEKIELQNDVVASALWATQLDKKLR